jgi:hypothetical protein
MCCIINLPTSINNNNTKSLGADSNSPSIGAYSVSKAPDNVSTQNVHFVDGDTPWSYDISSSPDVTTKLSGFSDAELGSFLSRPVKIKEFSWTPESTRLFEVFNPWTEFFTNIDVMEKINRFRNLRCHLRMKILLNGNSFYYGRALVSYNPFLANDSVTMNRAFFSQDLIGASQKPHFMLDPTTSQGGEMLLPFIWPENFVDITATDWHAELGRVTIHDFDILHHANGGSDPITVSVFVWAEDVNLSVPTTKLVDGLAQGVTQSGVADRELDEFGFPTYQEQAASKKKKNGVSRKVNNTSSHDEFTKDGLISKPASAIANAANVLSQIPVIAPYAKATSMVATRIGQVAKIFGYSRPQNLEDIHPYVPRYMGNLCNTDTPETLFKLSLDSKNELSIDTRVMGLGGEDELAISAIAQRPSFWQQFDWAESATADDLLASILVTPGLVQTLPHPTGTEIHPTALAFASAPFEAWQGSIKFRFNVVCSEYHRGRLRLVYNPLSNNSGAVAYNQVYSTTIDISEDRDFEYEVKWADIRAWNILYGADFYPLMTTFDTVANVSAGTVFDNGSLSVYVVNELATPSTTAADVKIQVWVSGGEDLAFAVPSTTGLKNTSYFVEQSEVYEPQAEEMPDTLATSNDASNAPDCSNEIQTFGDGSGMVPDDNQYLVYQGERIVSFRDMLRRYTYHSSWWPSEVGTGIRLVTTDLTDFPYYRGWDPNADDAGFPFVGSGSQPYNFCTQTLLNWLTPAFVCRRGGLRHKAILTGSFTNTLGSFGVARHNIQGISNGQSSHSLDNANIGDRRKKMQETLRASTGGTGLTPVANNPCLEYETAFYTAGQRFVPARDTNYYGSAHSGHELSNEVFDDRVGQRIDKYIATAEDFQLGLFIGAPVYYSYNNPIPA